MAWLKELRIAIATVPPLLWIALVLIVAAMCIAALSAFDAQAFSLT